jgi:predicted acetyltransferase
VDLELRPWTPDEHLDVMTALERTFLTDVDRLATEPMDMLEHGRTLSAWEDGRPVATAGAFSLRMALPGGVRPVAGVTLVSVQPTHRRQGLLRRLMQTQLEQLHASGEPVAALWASEPAIYGRFGYGAASRSLAVELHRGDTLRPDAAPGGPRVLELPPGEARPRLARVWDRAHPRRPGEYARDDAWWDHALWDPPAHRGGGMALRCAVLEDGSGYVLFSATSVWDDRGPNGGVQVKELIGVDGPAEVRLWRFLLGVDLVGTWRHRRTALDGALVGAVTDARRLTGRAGDGLMVRLVRVDQALAERSWAADVDVVLEVRDDQLPHNAGRWRLAAGADGATCTRTDDAPDVSLGVEELGAVHLGGTTLLSLVDAGRVVEHHQGAVRALSRAARGDVEPLCSHVF